MDEKPEWAEDGLLVDRYKIPAHKHPKQVAVVPNIAKLQIPPACGRVEHHVPLVDIERSVFHVIKIGLNPARAQSAPPPSPAS